MLSIFKKKINSITMAASLVAVSSLISRFLGIFRDRILAGEFGAGSTLDAYYAAFRIPDLIFNLLVLGALSAGFIPIFTQLLKKEKGNPFKDKTESWSLANNVLNSLFLPLIFFSILGIVFAPSLTNLITPGFSPELKELTANLTRIMFLSPIFLGISSIWGGILQSFKRFFVYSLAPIFYNLGIILGAVILAPRFGAIGLAWGVVIGAFLHMVIQMPLVFSLGFRYKLKFNFKDTNLRKIGKMMVPRTMSLAISQINLVVITIIASTLTAGSLAVFNFANNLQSFPVGIFGISFAIAAFPVLSANAFNKKKLIKNFSQTFRQILFFIIPSTVFLITLRAQIIRIILGTGKFNWEDTVLTMETLGFFALGLFAQATIPLLIRMFYARHNSKTPFFTGLITVVVNVFLSLYFSARLGVAGLALAFSLSSILNFLLLWITLHLNLKDLEEKKIFISALKFSLAALAAGVFIQLGKVLVWPFVDMTRFWGIFTQGLTAGLLGIIVYLLMCYLLKSEEFFYFFSSFKRKFSFKKVKTEDQSEARGL